MRASFFRGFIVRLSLLCASLVLTFGMVEGLLRVAPDLMPETARLYATDQNARSWKISTRPHPSIGFLYPPHVQRTIRGREVEFTYQTDAHGFRNTGPWPQTADIVALGDSMTFSFGVDWGDAWLTRVQDALQHSRVHNLALSGSAPQQSLRIYETFGLDLQPRVLLMGLFLGNDLKDAVQFDAWVQSGVGGNFKLWRSFRIASPGFQYLLAGLVKRSYVFALLLDRYRAMQADVEGDVRPLTFPDGGRLVLLPRLLETLAEQAQPGRPAFRLIVETLTDMHQLAQTQDTHLVVMLFPTKEEVYLPTVSDAYARDPAASIRDALIQRGIQVLDLGPHFRKRAAAGERLFFERDGHPNEQGNALVARVVLDHLQANAEVYGLSERVRKSS